MADIARLTRMPERGSTDRADLDALLDEVLVATVSTVVDGEPWSVPLLFARDGDRVLLHGSTGAGMLRAVAAGARATFCVHAIDGLVVATTTFDSSANYRSAVIRGTLETVPADERDAALRLLSDRLIPGRMAEVRGNLPKELAATVVLSLPIGDDNWLFKARRGPSGEPDEPAPGVWAGVVPLRVVADEPERDAWVDDAVPVPASVEELGRRFR